MFQIINSIALRFTIVPGREICSININTLYIFISAADNVVKRNEHRLTMGKEELRKRFNYEMIFLGGKPTDQIVQSSINDEAALFEDILQVDVLDTYQNLFALFLLLVMYYFWLILEKVPLILVYHLIIDDFFYIILYCTISFDGQDKCFMGKHGVRLNFKRLYFQH